MLITALSNANSHYWEAEVQEPVAPNQKKIKVDDESVSDSILMVKMAISSIKTCQHNPLANKGLDSGATKKMSTQTNGKNSILTDINHNPTNGISVYFTACSQ